MTENPGRAVDAAIAAAQTDLASLKAKRAETERHRAEAARYDAKEAAEVAGRVRHLDDSIAAKEAEIGSLMAATAPEAA